MKRLSVVILLVLLVPATSVHPAEWPESSPASQDVDAEMLRSLDAEIRDGQHGFVDSVLVIRNGHIVFDRTYDQDYASANEPYDDKPGPWSYRNETWHPWYQGEKKLHTMQSVSKSVLSALYGIAQHKGELPPLDTPALALLEDRQFDDPDGRKAAITLNDLLTMRAGIDWDESSTDYNDPANTCAAMEASDDWVQYVLERPMAHDPGAAYEYNSGVTMVLGEILEQVTGRRISEYAETELFAPLGIKAHYWKQEPAGLADVEGGLYLAPRDIARIVQLYLQEGEWNGRQLVSADWIEKSVFPATPSTYPDSPPWDKVGYGYQWWNFTDMLSQPELSMWGGVGYGGQYPVAIPELDMVIVITGWNIYDDATSPLELIERFIIPAATAGRKGGLRAQIGLLFEHEGHPSSGRGP